MREREYIIQELWRRLALVPGVNFTGRNPKGPPDVDNLPAIVFFEMPDVVEEADMRGATKLPNYRRRMTVVIECYISASTEQSSTLELLNFVKKVKIELYRGGITLGGLCAFKEVEASRIYRPPAGNHVIGVGFPIEIVYIEDIALLSTTTTSTTTTSTTTV